jgi:GT2 family glycosyltransferase
MTYPNQKKVVVITVTYGNRWRYLEDVLKAPELHHPAISDIVVVDNASEEDIEARIQENQFSKTHIVRLRENTGSANGFKVGIQYALDKTNASLIWLLDDDNKPREGALSRLLAVHCALGNDANNVLLSLRKDRREYLESAHMGVGIRFIANSFLGFHIKNLPKKIIARFHKRKTLPHFHFPVISVGYAPYGGLLFHRDWIEKIGLPNPDYFIYGDDHEYTNRIICKGGIIYLCAISEIEDKEISWIYRDKSIRFVSPFSDEDKVYYSVRNRVHFERTNYVSSEFCYGLNQLLYLIYLFVRGIISFRDPLGLYKRSLLLFRAISDGQKGRLGRLM